MDGGRKTRIEIVKLGLQIANGVTISIKFSLYNKHLYIEFIFLPGKFIKVRKYGFARASLNGGKFGNKSLNSYSELFLSLGSILGLKD